MCSINGVEERLYNIGIKRDFLCINICWAPREVLKTRAWKARVSISPKDPNRTLGFLRRNLLACPQDVHKMFLIKESAYKAPSPGLSYCSSRFNVDIVFFSAI